MDVFTEKITFCVILKIEKIYLSFILILEKSTIKVKLTTKLIWRDLMLVWDLWIHL